MWEQKVTCIQGWRDMGCMVGGGCRAVAAAAVAPTHLVYILHTPTALGYECHSVVVGLLVVPLHHLLCEDGWGEVREQDCGRR